jgi:SAM-dependent methyltransferase
MTADNATVQDGAPQGEARATPAELRRLARAHWAADRPDAALAAAWAAYEEQPEDCDGRALLARLLLQYPDRIGLERKSALLDFLQHPRIDPDQISPAGWRLVRRADDGFTQARDDGDLAALAARLADDDLVLALLRESPVGDRAVERTLTRLRRWLLLSSGWREHPRLVEALGAQAMLNGGAWPFDDMERARLEMSGPRPIAAAYLPRPDRPAKPKSDIDAHAVTRAVRTQYEGWPFPAWRRITVPGAMRLSDEIRRLDPDGPDSILDEAGILVAGCGTGREAATLALTYPQARVTAIDISEASLAYARRQCALVGAPNIRFIRLDLHDCAQIGERFDAVFCSGVLHHLPDPEAGWGALAAVLRPGGVMKIMLYSRIARFMVTAARSLIQDLANEPMTDDLLRRVRRRILERPDHAATKPLMDTNDFSTLVGTYDLLLHPHEDPFDVPRIARALDRFGLRLIAFLLPSADAAARYDAQHPHDPRHRDMAAWARFEKSELPRYAGLYTFMCRKPFAD